MRILDPIGQCEACLLNLARNAAIMAGIGEESQPAVLAAARRALEAARAESLNSPQIANRILREIQRLSGVEDPFAAFKNEEMRLARQLAERLAGGEPGDMDRRLDLAVMGNCLDFFTDPAQALGRIQEMYTAPLSYAVDHRGHFKERMAWRPDLVLYLTDNAGEIFFDLPLYHELARLARRLVLVVKGGPALNDLTRAEIARAGLEGCFDEVADTGIDGAGIDWDHSSAKFRDLVGEADLAVAKGMANFETLYARGDLPVPFLFLFTVKCRPIQRALEVPAGSFCAVWKPPGHLPAAQAVCSVFQ